MKGDANFIDSTIERAIIAIASTSIVIFATCLSALSSVTCAAMAETYAAAIAHSGLIALGAALSWYLVTLFGEINSRSSKTSRTIFIVKFTVIVVLEVCFSNVGNTIIADARAATKWCYVGTPAEIAGHAHQYMPLYKVFGGRE